MPPNREALLVEALAAAAPTAVVFDRFYAEEAFSFRVRELAPRALRILDMQDFHALRACRQRLAEAGAPPAGVLAARPDAHAPECLRELAAIHRSDLTLVCSPVEMDMLVRHYGVPASKLVLAPFFAPPSPYDQQAAGGAQAAAAAAAGQSSAAAAAAPGQSSTAAAARGGSAACPPFHERRHFVMIGNWRHPPNLDSARWACSELWPALRAALPAGEREHAELHLYGAYAAGAAQQLHRPKEGVRMMGFAPSLDLMLRYRALLAPLRFGAGLKGKIVDAWWHGLPVLTTPLGAEGMTAADADPADLVTAGTAVAAAQAAADPACDGHVWQLGDGSVCSEAEAAAGSSQDDWGGLCSADTSAGLAAAAALLYSDEQLWSSCQQRGFQLLRLLYDAERNLARVHAAVEAAAAELEARRASDFTGAMLWSQQLRATEYFSRWIELKETLKQQGGNLAERIRPDFDILRNKPSLCYLDTAATALKPNAVLKAMHDYYHMSTANIHKGVEHELSKESTDHYEAARRKVAAFINAPRPEEVVFTRNATEAINVVAHGWGLQNLGPGDQILMSVAEHHSSLAPWQQVAQKTGATIVDVCLTEATQEIDLEDLQAKLRPGKTKIVVMVHLSNVLGSVLPADRVCQLAHEPVALAGGPCLLPGAQAGALVLLDSCQYLPHRTTDVQALGCDWLVASGHKMLGPTSSGFLWGRYDLLCTMEPLMVGGSTTGEIHFGAHSNVPPPLRFEAGTPAIAEAIGLGAAVDYLTALGMDQVNQYEEELARELYCQLAGLPGATILGPPPDVPMGRASLAAFYIDGCDMMQLAAELDKQHMAVSAGFHRVKPLHQDYLHIGPTMRASAYIYNTKDEIQRFVAALRQCMEAQQRLRKPS
ncbi:hypothetical protein ABPG77_005135 [Micractinium sp. CCAP 211/92]